MDKLKMHSLNKVDENIKKIGAQFPNCITERKNQQGEVEYAIDFDMLKQELSSVIVEGREERYQFTWPDKKKSILLANAPIAKTLRPCREESVDFDNTENLYIEGDNLEVLKLLQETYLGKVKMIYIDPPYNTGNDFVYEDDFAQSSSEYLENSGQFDDEGNRLIKNMETNGRFHTDWLNMIYPRLKLARDLLTDDGVIFISIDDNELNNLRKICDEVFGEDNFIATLVWAAGRKNDSRYISVSHEYILCYVKSSNTLFEKKILWREKKQGLNEIYSQCELLKKTYQADYRTMANELKKWYRNLPVTHPSRNHSHYSYIDENGIYFPSDISWPGGGGPKYEVLHPITRKPVKIPSRGWVYPNADRMREIIEKGLVHFGDDENSVPCKKSYLSEGEYSTPYSVFYKDGRASTKRLRALMGTMVFQNPKDEEIIKSLIEFTLTNKNSIILDFFSGSSTTAHAVMQLNAEDGGNRKFIMVQLPESTDEKSEAYKAGYKNICEIGKERIRRAGNKIAQENPQAKFDKGFRVLRCDSSNMKEVYYNPAEYNTYLFNALIDNIKADRTAEDLLFQVMLDLGVLLSSDIKQTTIADKTVFNVADNFLMACFDTDINEEVITAIAKQKPYYFVMRDSSMANDSVATNFEQIFTIYSPETKRKVL
ncbi:site-specific DNA-methyltransferase [Snodgrassella alvi]|uniref:site-specific DNA-methyltransferase (adenine-specific) n=1 Tax=Snodgrassella alvi TaxID=1196083 RepID=A0A855G6B2_9NEIS|nr:site-specific DNA-methyltransferase [Snodgrassella alvi]PIT59430.1 DNA methyltransferase [Snodgrassella alvi]